jgi:hypothetical protein
MATRIIPPRRQQLAFLGILILLAVAATLGSVLLLVLAAIGAFLVLPV